MTALRIPDHAMPETRRYVENRSACGDASAHHHFRCAPRGEVVAISPPSRENHGDTREFLAYLRRLHAIADA